MSELEKITITKYDLLYEQRMSKVETTLECMDKNFRDAIKEMRADFRWLVLIMIGGFGGLFGLMVHGFKWL